MAVRKTVDVLIPVKAISTNKLYGGIKRRSVYYRNYRKTVLDFLKENYPHTAIFPKNMVLTMEVGFSSPLSDASNAIKGVEDCIAEHFGFNDRQIVTLRIDKFLVDKGQEYTRIKLRSTNKDIDRRTKRVKGKRNVQRDSGSTGAARRKGKA